MVGGEKRGYTIVRPIGEGGMAVVYLAWQESLGRHVALKELSRFDAKSPDLVERFLRESRVAGSLQHRHIVTVYEFFEDGGLPYIAMEYLPRGSLRPYVARLSPAHFIGVMKGVLAGLDHAEEQGIVHRDIKPDNVLVTSDGDVKIADFGIAKARHTLGPKLTLPGAAVGTPDYMAPEQVRGGRLGAWTDLYSVGIMAWELLIGRTPFEGLDEPEILRRQVQEPVPAAVSLNPRISPEVSDWIDGLLRKDPAERSQSPATAWSELEEIAVDRLGAFWEHDARLPSESQLIDGPDERATPTPHVVTGTIIDRRYRIDGVLGSGGMAVVYRATHLRLGKKVALKVISPGFAADPEFRQRFEREARAAADLDHDHVVPVHDYGEDKHGPYIVMRYIEGPNLRDFLRARGPIKPERAVQMLESIAAALDAAHARGLLHRDVKPANILIEDSTGRVFLTDFGLARPASSDDATKSRVMGTEGYMAPERRRGEDTVAGDVYSLACVLWDMLAGLDRPLPGYSAHRVTEGLPEQLVRIVERGINERPFDRFDSAGALARAARLAIEGTVDVDGKKTTGPGLESLSEGLRAQVIALCDRVLETLETGVPRREVVAIRDSLSEPLSLALVGVRGAGKSTLVNALLGRRIAPTGPGGVPHVPTRYRYDRSERVELLLPAGAREHGSFTPDGRLPKLEGSTRDRLVGIDVWLPVNSLREFSILDLPGVDDLTSESAPLLAAPGDETVPIQVPDALLFALEGRAEEIERAVLEAFRSRFGGAARANATNVIGVLTKADLIVDESDRWEDAVREADRWCAALGALVTAVVPVAGLLAETVATGALTDSIVHQLVASMDPDKTDAPHRLRESLPEFAAITSPGPLPAHERIMALLGPFGLRRMREILESDPVSGVELMRSLRELSGLEDLRKQIDHLQLRTDALKADAALIKLDDITWEHPDVLEPLRDEIDRLRLHGRDMHLLVVMRDFDKCANGEIVLGEGMLAELEQLLTGRTTAERLGLARDGGGEEQRAAASRRVREWRSYVNSGLASFASAKVADNVVRSYEVLAAASTEAQVEKPM